MANVKVDEKVDDASMDGEDDFKIPEGVLSYQEYFKRLAYNLFTFGVGLDDAIDKASSESSVYQANSAGDLREESEQDTFPIIGPGKSTVTAEDAVNRAVGGTADSRSGAC